MTQRRDIGARLENWSAWCNGRLSPRAAVCATGAMCEQLRRDAQGGLPGGHRCEVNENDALAIERAMRDLTQQHRDLLKYCYIKGDRPEIVCKKLNIPVRPVATFVEIFHAAQAAVEAAIK